MTEAELDVAGAEVHDCVKAFLKYCPDGSVDSATRSAMDYAKTKYTMNNIEYRKLCDSARAAFCSINKIPLKPNFRQNQSGRSDQRKFQGKQK